MIGEERIKRLKAEGRIRLDAKVFQTFWENQALIPERLKERVNGNIQFIYFDGTILRSPDGDRCTLYLYFDGGGSWDWGCGWLDRGRGAGSPSAALASRS